MLALLDTLPDNDATTTPTFWECECDGLVLSLHPRQHGRCFICGSNRDDSPDARLSVVLGALVTEAIRREFPYGAADKFDKEDNKMKTTKIQSSHGSIEIETATGLVVSLLELDLATFGRTNVPVRFNIEEWYRRYPTRSLADQESWDILDFGYWCYDHVHAMHVKYESPCEEWREDRRLEVERDLQN